MSEGKVLAIQEVDEPAGSTVRPQGPWVTDGPTDKLLLYAGLYITLGVLAYAAILGEFPRITHQNSGLAGTISLSVGLLLFSPHLLATVWLAFGNNALRDATPDGGRRFRLANIVFIAMLIPLLIVASQREGSLLIVFALIGLLDAFHFTAQDRGFLSVYRHRVQQDAKFAKRDNRLMYYVMPWVILNTLATPNGAFWIDIGVVGQRWPATLPTWLFPCSHVILAILFLDVVRGEFQRAEGPHWPKLIFMVSALSSYILVPLTPILGYLASRVHHGATYLGLSRHMVRRLDADGRFRGKLFPRLAKSNLAVYVGGMGILALPVSIAMAMAGHLDDAHQGAGLVLGINFHHYFVDAVIWRFRRPEVRAGVAAYI